MKLIKIIRNLCSINIEEVSKVRGEPDCLLGCSATIVHRLRKEGI